MKTSKIIAVVISALVIRAFLEIFASNVLSVKSFYFDNFMQMLMYGLIGACLWKYYALGYKSSFDQGVSGDRLLFLSMPLVLICILFSYGSMTIIASLGSHINSELIYGYFNFQPKRNGVFDFFSGPVLVFLISTAIVAPIIEEIVFRGMLLVNLVKIRGAGAGVVITSLIFTMFHFSSPDLIGTMAFSIVLSIFYIKYGSIRSCMIFHSTYNLTAFVYQYYFGGWWVRSINTLTDFESWKNGYLVFALSVIGIFYLYKLGYLKIKNNQPNFLTVAGGKFNSEEQPPKR